nr:hypothetical protein [Tanacetum cinerariifolium]
MTEVCQDRIAFVRELESVAGVTVTAKAAVFLKEMMFKEGSRKWQLIDLEKEAKERALEIDRIMVLCPKAAKVRIMHELIIVDNIGTHFFAICVKEKPVEYVIIPYESCRGICRQNKNSVEINVAGNFVSSIVGLHVTFFGTIFLLIVSVNNGVVADAWSMSEDYRLASEINRVTGEVNNVVVVKDQFLEELYSLVCMAELPTDRTALNEYMGVWFRSKRLKENHAEDLEQLRILNVLVARMYLVIVLMVVTISSSYLRLVGEINALCVGLTTVIDEKENFFDELNVMVGMSVPEKMAEFMKGVQDKDIPNPMKLQILGREFELRA